MNFPTPLSLKKIAERLSRPVYIVGGYVRNFLLFGETLSTDIDICGSLSYEELTKELKDWAKITPVNPRIGTVLITADGDNYEYTTFRRDSYLKGGAHTPYKVEFVNTPEEDALRRDFKINAIYYDVKNDSVRDYLGGLDDLEKRVISTADRWQKTFGEDGLRLLRAARFASQLGFELSDECLYGAKTSKELLSDVSVERKREELDLIMNADKKYGVKGAHLRGTELLGEIGLFEYLTPTTSPKFDPRAFSENSKAFADSVNYRLAAFTWCAGKSKEPSYVREILGENGLRFPNKKVEEVVFIINALNNIRDDGSLKDYVAANPDLVPALDELAPLVGNAYAARSGKTLVRLRDKGAPLSVKELGLDGSLLEKLGIPPRKRSVALKALVEKSIREERRLEESEAIDFLKGYSE